MKVAYIRVSTVEQNEERQIQAMKEQNVDKIFIDKCSGKDTNRPQLQEMLGYVREGDLILVHDMSRLARSTKDLLDILKFLEDKGVHIKSNKGDIDTTTPTGKLMTTVLSAIYEFERANMLERQREGIAIAKAKGKYKGRKQIERPNNWDEVYAQWKSRELTGTKAMELLKLKRNTFYKMVKEYESHSSS